MSVYPVTFGFSERFLADRQRLTYVIAATIVVLILLETLITAHFHVQRLALFALIFVIVAAAIVILIIVQNRYIFSRWRQMSLYVGPDAFVREAGAVRQEVHWDSITKVRFRHNPRDELRSIEVFTPNGSPLMLFGYEPMSEIGGLIKDHVPATTQVEIKRHWLDWENPLIMVAGILTGALVFEAIRQMGSQVIFVSMSALVQTAFGILFLVYGPLSRINPNLRKWEVILGALLIMLTSIMLIIKVVELSG